MGGLLGAIVDCPATPNGGRVAALAAFIVSGLAAAPMQLLVFVMLFENWFDITPLVRGIAMFTGFMAAVLVRLIGVLTGTLSIPGNPD